MNKFISRDLADLGVAVWGDRKRSLSYNGLIALRMAYEYPRSLSAASRVDIIRKVLKSPRKKYIALDGGKVVVRINTARNAVAQGLRNLHAAESAVDVDATVLGGEPCLKGTRIPVYVVAGIAKASGKSAASRTYSSLTASDIDLACFYANAYPRRGRPRLVGSMLAKGKSIKSKSFAVTID
ncbi:MAG: DUF433 domain-containing protein [Hyphomicrobiaceae bacterium]